MSISRFSLKNNVAVISGAGRGIGAKIAETFSEAGANLVICSRSEADLKAVSEKGKAHGTEIHYLVIESQAETGDAIIAFQVSICTQADLVSRSVYGFMTLIHRYGNMIRLLQ